jgi:hypothetical protein
MLTYYIALRDSNGLFFPQQLVISPRTAQNVHYVKPGDVVIFEDKQLMPAYNYFSLLTPTRWKHGLDALVLSDMPIVDSGVDWGDLISNL